MTVDHLLDTISSYELTEWKEFYLLRDEEAKKQIEAERRKGR